MYYPKYAHQIEERYYGQLRPYIYDYPYYDHPYYDYPTSEPVDEAAAIGWFEEIINWLFNQLVRLGSGTGIETAKENQSTYPIYPDTEQQYGAAK